MNKKFRKIKINVEPKLKHLVPKYLESRKQDLEKLKQAFEEGDLLSVEKMSHMISGNAASYGFGELTVICRKMEQAASAKNSAMIESLLKEYNEYIYLVELT